VEPYAEKGGKSPWAERFRGAWDWWSWGRMTGLEKSWKNRFTARDGRLKIKVSEMEHFLMIVEVVSSVSLTREKLPVIQIHLS
jgi:hypothetical protein